MVSTDCRRCLTAKEASKFGSVITYLKQKVINPGPNQTVVETERQDHQRKKGIAWGLRLFSVVVMTAYLDQIFMTWTNSCVSFCLEGPAESSFYLLSTRTEMSQYK